MDTFWNKRFPIEILFFFHTDKLPEIFILRLEKTTGTCFICPGSHPVKKLCGTDYIQVPICQFFIVNINPRRPWNTGYDFFRIMKIVTVMGSVIRISNYCGYGRTSSACTSRTLLIIFPHGRNVSQTNCGQ